MRNLKKALSLALALVMLLGMMMVGAGAAEINDIDSVKADNQEAVKVMNALEILVGDENGDFNGAGTLTRAAAAKIVLGVARGMGIVKASLGTSVSAIFDDMTDPDYKWAAGLVDVCETLGIVKGTDPGKFTPEANVTNMQFATMLTRVMDAANADLYADAATYEVNVKIFVLKSGLDEKVGITDWNADMTREQAAQMAFNALIKDADGGKVRYPVTTAGGTKIYFDTPTEAALYAAVLEVEPGVPERDTTGTLGEVNFGLKQDTTTGDELGLPTVTWTATNPKAEVVVPADANATVTISKACNNAQAAGLNDYTVAATATMKVDGETVAFEKTAADASGSTARMTQLLTKTGNDVTVYVYATDKVISKVVAVTDYVGKVTSVVAGKDGKADTVRMGGRSFEANGYEKDDYVLYNLGKKGDNTVVLNTAKAEAITGTMTQYTNDKKYTIGGNVYQIAGASLTNTTDLEKFIGKELTVYVNADGKIVAAEAVTASGAAAVNYIYVLGNSNTKTNSDYMGNTAYTVDITGVTTDGTVQSFTVERSTSGDAINETFKGKVYAYTTKSNGNIELGAEVSPDTTNAITVGAPAVSVGGPILNSQTAFIFVDIENPDAENGVALKLDSNAVVQVGNSNIGKTIEAATKTYVIAQGGVAKAVFVMTAFDEEAKDTSDLVYVNSEKWSSTTDADGVTVYSYEAYDVEGTKISVTSSSGSLVSQVYVLKEDGSVGAAAANQVYADQYITDINGSVVSINGTPLNYSEDIVAYVAGSSLEKGQEVVYTLTTGGSTTIARMWVIKDDVVSTEVPASATGLKAVNVPANGTKTIEGDVKGDVNVGANATLNVGGNLESTANITVNPSSVVKVTGTQNAAVTVVKGGDLQGTASNPWNAFRPECGVGVRVLGDNWGTTFDGSSICQPSWKPLIIRWSDLAWGDAVAKYATKDEDGAITAKKVIVTVKAGNDIIYQELGETGLTVINTNPLNTGEIYWKKGDASITSGETVFTITVHEMAEGIAWNDANDAPATPASEAYAIKSADTLLYTFTCKAP